MKIITWNIMHGGGRRVRRITAALEKHHADILILTEYRHNASGEILKSWLSESGFRYRVVPPAKEKQNVVMVAAKTPFEAVQFPGQMSDLDGTDYSNRVVLARFCSLNIFGIYMPNQVRKRSVFDFLLNLPKEFLSKQSILMGDFNTGRHYEDESGATFVSAHQFESLLSMGWIDPWRKRNPDARQFTWYSKGYHNGFRLDHALVSPSVEEKVSDVRYSHAERGSGISDHSLMILALEPSENFPLPHSPFLLLT